MVKLSKGWNLIKLSWRGIVLLILAAAFVPFFLQRLHTPSFYAFLIPLSMLIYLVLITLHFRIKRKFIRQYVEHSAMRLLIGLVILALTFIAINMEAILIGQVLVVAAALCYAAFVQRLGLLKWVAL